MMDLQKVLHLNASSMPHEIKTVEQAVRFIDERLPSELRHLSRWRFARALLVEAIKTNKSRDVRAATRQLEQALGNEGWLRAMES
jgi:hypothetical protein